MSLRDTTSSRRTSDPRRRHGVPAGVPDQEVR